MTGADFRSDDLRAAWSSAGGVADDARDCPSTERLRDSVRDALPREDNEAVVLHLGACPACAAAWRAARELFPDETSATPHPRELPWPLALAAGLAIAFVVGGMVSRYLPPRTTQAPAFRTQEEEAIRSELPADRPVSRSDCVLRWSAGPAGTTWDVVVTDSTLRPLERAWRLESPELRLDEDALQDVSEGEDILWRVTAWLPDGRQQRSKTFRTRVK
jgi:hypothetical protein